MNFVPDSIVTGRRFRALTIVDDFSLECPAIKVDKSIVGRRLVALLASL
jgi:putative transposase